MDNTIKLAFRGTPGIEIEGVAAEDVMAGMILTKNNLGQYLPHDDLNGFVMPWVAVEEPYTGGYEKDLDQDTYYEAGDRVYVLVPRAGDMMWMWLAHDDVEIGALLASNADGMLHQVEISPVTAGGIVGVAYEAADASVAPVRVKVEIAK